MASPGDSLTIHNAVMHRSGRELTLQSRQDRLIANGQRIDNSNGITVLKG